MHEHDLHEVEEKFRQIGNAHRAWVIPILKTLDELGGRAKPRVVRERILASMHDRLTDKQRDYVARKGRLGWARHSMRQIGLVTGEAGTWEITDLGRRLLAQIGQEDHVDASTIPEEDQETSGVTESVAVTDYTGYHIPLLRVMADGTTDKRQIMSRLHEQLEAHFLPGDLRTMPKGQTVYEYRASWVLTELKSRGEAKNVAFGRWDITEAGRQRLAREEPAWSLAAAQHSKAAVRVEAATPTSARPARPASASLPPRWSSSRLGLSPRLFSALDARLRPDLGATPATPLSRNVILYGPPGTGKTFIARHLAAALTEDEESGLNSHWRLVQFHPSYAYEDFIQGMRPDLQQTTLRYTLSKGPFLELCAAADEDPDQFFVLVIDEINRGDPARIFGELLYALEYRGQPVDLPLGGQLTIPPNLIVIGTMNSVDRSVALVDYALRRRFGFVRIEPDPAVIATVRSGQPYARIAAQALETFNGWLTTRLDPDHALGHSYFLNAAIPLEDAAALEQVWSLDLRPQLEEYLFGEPSALLEARSQWTKAVAEATAETASEQAADESE